MYINWLDIHIYDELSENWVANVAIGISCLLRILNSKWTNDTRM